MSWYYCLYFYLKPEVVFNELRLINQLAPRLAYFTPCFIFCCLSKYAPVDYNYIFVQGLLLIFLYTKQMTNRFFICCSTQISSSLALNELLLHHAHTLQS